MITTGHATREGTAKDNADACRVYRLADGTVGAAVVDGIGHGPRTSATAPLLAETAARITARRGPLAGLLTAGELIAESTAHPDEADAVAVTARVRVHEVGAVVSWTGDCRAYGWDGITLTRYTDDHTVGQQLRANGVPVEVARDHDNWLRTSLSRATVGTVYTVTVDDPLVILTSDGVHDQVPPRVLETVVRTLETDPQALADRLVAEARGRGSGYRDDATAVVIRIGEPES
ncbi:MULTISPECIES: PP2C family protein-serine/threonine phosphatase [Streptomyces]|uniref:PP2C family protein-serine/threonine phosphatase n=1 Tax=Streptomyces TaxID=1883 RepID=UPI0016790091|nr:MULTISPECIES: SpoIIE family protein phosphatase [Streptomyces]MBK3524831.1 SpoIIE family protein phosphatase [Streptomyces sp. MBT70]GGR71061.1 serine/threonine protein phosphatase [Streptomyces eurythermus]